MIQVQANEVLTKRIRSIKCNLMRQDGGVSVGAQKMNLSFVSRLTCTWDQIRWKQCQTMVAPCLGSQEGDCFSIFSKPDCPETTFSYSHKNPELHPFPEPKKATIYFTAILIRIWVHLLEPDPPIRCIWRPNYPLSIIKQRRENFYCSRKNAVEVLLFHILENSSPFYSSLFSSQLPHPHE